MVSTSKSAQPTVAGQQAEPLSRTPFSGTQDFEDAERRPDRSPRANTVTAEDAPSCGTTTRTGSSPTTHRPPPNRARDAIPNWSPNKGCSKYVNCCVDIVLTDTDTDTDTDTGDRYRLRLANGALTHRAAEQRATPTSTSPPRPVPFRPSRSAA